MSDVRAAVRYAQALLAVAEETRKLDAVSSDLEGIRALIAQVREFAVFLKSPVINIEKKKRVLTQLFKGRLDVLTSNFIHLLASKGRERLLPEIIGEFYRLRDEHLGIITVTAKSAVRLTPGEERELVTQLEKATRKKVTMTAVIDPSLVGGFTVQHEDTVWDASVRHELEVLRRRLIEGVV